MTTSPELTITFLGGATSIGASCALLSVSGTEILVDCGIRLQGASLPDLSVLSERRIDAIALTHAHTDHSGALPVVCESFSAAPVLATPPTIDLVNILFRDALKLMHEASEHDGELPLYSAAQVDRLQKQLRPVTPGSSFDVGPVRLTWLPAAHILGAAMVHCATPAGNVLFTGDFSVSAQRTVPALDRPSLAVDLVVTEATYGNRLHEDRKAAEQRLVERIKEVLGRGGRVLVPAFAIGRAQEVLLILKHAQRTGRLPAIPVFVDGMVRSVCEVYRRHERYLTRQMAHEIQSMSHPFYTDQIRPVRNAEERKAALTVGPCVIVASSGMLTGGASVVYAAAMAEKPEDTILLTGYQDEESPGRALLQISEQPETDRKITLNKQTLDLRCQVDKYGLSAHADRMQLVAFIDALRPRGVILVHGDTEAKSSLARGLECRDVVQAEDGISVTRRYPRRAVSELLTVSAAGDLPADLDAARRLLGPARDTAISSETIAQAWFGRAVGRADRERLLDHLVGLGVARRDDRRRSHLWVLTPTQSALFPEEAAQEETLKRENPKGRLLEYCMRAQIGPPSLEELGIDGHEFLMRMTLDHHGELLQSPISRAATKKTAEQVCAREMLEQLAVLSRSLDVVEVIADASPRASDLKSSNYKNQLLEWCIKHRHDAPRFESRVHVDGTASRAGGSPLAGSTQWTRWYLSTSQKLGEQAASEALLDLLRRKRDRIAASPDTGHDDVAEEPVADGQRQPRKATDGVAGESASSAGTLPGGAQYTTTSRDVRMALNELRQRGYLRDFGYELVDRSGPAHQPVFRVAAWASLPGGEHMKTEPFGAASRKDGERGAAQRLYQMLIDVAAIIPDKG